MKNENRNLYTVLREGVQFELTQDFYFIFPLSLKHRSFYNHGFFTQSPLMNYYIKVPAGFKTDFGTIPLLFQSIISPVGKPTKSFVVHDYLCYLSHQGLLKRSLADRVFLECMKIQKVNIIKRMVIYLSVRVFAIAKGL